MRAAETRRRSPKTSLRSFALKFPTGNCSRSTASHVCSARSQFDDFAAALAFTNRVGGISEDEGHHPALLTEWGRVTVSWWTHRIRGLHRNDFVMAAKTDELYGGD